MTKYVCTVCGYIAEGSIPEFCPVCKAPASKFIEKKDNTYVTEHVVGIAKDVPEEIKQGLRENFNGECSEVGMYLAMSRVADREAIPRSPRPGNATPLRRPSMLQVCRATGRGLDRQHQEEPADAR